MALAMDCAALNVFLDRVFPQIADQVRVESVDAQMLIARLRVDDRHLRPGGTVSGPSMFALADVTIYLAILARIGEVALAVTTNASIDFMRKPEAGRDLLAEWQAVTGLDGRLPDRADDRHFNQMSTARLEALGAWPGGITWLRHALREMAQQDGILPGRA